MPNTLLLLGERTDVLVIPWGVSINLNISLPFYFSPNKKNKIAPRHHFSKQIKVNCMKSKLAVGSANPKKVPKIITATPPTKSLRSGVENEKNITHRPSISAASSLKSLVIVSGVEHDKNVTRPSISAATSSMKKIINHNKRLSNTHFIRQIKNDEALDRVTISMSLAFTNNIHLQQRR